MIRATIIAAALLASPAMAESPAKHWGGSSAILTPGEGHAVARVLCINRLTSGHGMALTFDLALGGFSVAVRVDHGAGDIPDRYTVTPPPGYIAVPPYVDVGEHDEAVIMIFSVEGVGA